MPAYDFYIDEDKQNRLLGILAVPNSVGLEQILASVKQQYGVAREIKWNALERFRMPIAVSWVRVAGWYNGLRFSCIPWPGGTKKGDVLQSHLLRFMTQHQIAQLGGRADS